MKGTVKKEGSTWYYRVHTIQDTNGNYKYKKKRGFKTKRECEKALAELIVQLENGLYIANENILVKDYMPIWLEKYPKQECEISTYKRYCEFSKDIVNYLGKYKLSKLNPLIIEDFYNYLINTRNLSNNTVIKLHRVMHLAFKHAMKWGYVNNNPCDLASPPKAQKYEMRFWNNEEIICNLKKLEQEPLYPVFFLAIHTGLRIGELCALTWSDIDLNRGILKVTKSSRRLDKDLIKNRDVKIISNCQTSSKTAVVSKRTKTANSNREVVLLDKAMSMIKIIRIKQLERKASLNITPMYILDWEDGRPLDPHYVTQNFPRILKKHNIVPLIRFHDLRHSHATLLQNSGTSIKVISKRLGHSNVGFTIDTYIHSDLENQKEEISKADILL